MCIIINDLVFFFQITGPSGAFAPITELWEIFINICKTAYKPSFLSYS